MATGKKHNQVWVVVKSIIADMITYSLNKPIYFLFKDFASEVSYACERIIIIIIPKF